MQNTAGTQQMANAQDQINAQIAKFQQAWGYPTQQMGVLQSALGMTPYGQSTTGTSDTQTYTPTDWAALAGAGIGAFGNVFGGKGSDIRIKKNLKKVGKGVTGLPVYDFNFKGEPPGAPKTRGPMAQDIEKQFPGAVRRSSADRRQACPRGRARRAVRAGAARLARARSGRSRRCRARSIVGVSGRLRSQEL